jgi:hypothetical protein
MVVTNFMFPYLWMQKAPSDTELPNWKADCRKGLQRRLRASKSFQVLKQVKPDDCGDDNDN